MNKIKKRWLPLLVLIIVLSVGIVGCNNDTDDTQTGDPDIKDKVEDAGEDIKDPVDDTVKDAEDSVRDMNYEDIKIRPEEAFDKFMELHADTKINQFDLGKGLMEYKYEIEGYDNKNEYEVKINPVDGKVISDDSETLDMDSEDVEITKDHLAKVDSIIKKAKKEDASNSELDEWSISVEDGKVVMDIEIGATEYSYDMETEELIERDM